MEMDSTSFVQIIVVNGLSLSLSLGKHLCVVNYRYAVEANVSGGGEANSCTNEPTAWTPLARTLGLSPRDINHIDSVARNESRLCLCDVWRGISEQGPPPSLIFGDGGAALVDFLSPFSVCRKSCRTGSPPPPPLSTRRAWGLRVVPSCMQMAGR